MKRIAFSLLMALTSAAAVAQFEGIADFKMTQGDDLRGSGRMYVSKNGFRMEWTMEESSAASRRGAGKDRQHRMTMVSKASEPDVTYMLNDEAKTYSAYDSRKARERAAESKEKYTVEKLGTDTVAGFSCRKARLRSSKGTDIEVCVTKELGESTPWLSAMDRGAGSSWINALRDSGLEGFPVRWTVRGTGRGDSTTMELTKVERKAPSASLFQVPPDYKKTDALSVGLSPEQKKQLDQALKDMPPEQRKQYEEMMRQHGQPTPEP